jgi:hypothetical protein
MARKRGRVTRRRTHACATTTPRIRRAIQASDEKDIVLAERYGVNPKTVAKWKWRDFDSDARMGPKNPTSSVLSHDQEAIILAYRWRTRLALNDCHERMRRLFPNLSRSGLYRCWKRHGYGRIGRTEPCPPLTERNQRGPYTFEITFNEVIFHDDFIGEIIFVFLAVEESTKHVYAEVASPTPENAAAFLARLVSEFPQRIIAVTTDIHPIFTDRRASFDQDWRRLAHILSPSPAAPTGSPTCGQFLHTESSPS